MSVTAKKRTRGGVSHDEAKPIERGRAEAPSDSPVFPEEARGIVTAEQVARLAAAGVCIALASRIAERDQEYRRGLRSVERERDAALARVEKIADLETGVAVCCAKNEAEVAKLRPLVDILVAMLRNRAAPELDPKTRANLLADLASELRDAGMEVQS